MWNKCFSNFLVIKLRHQAIRITFPVPLYIFGDLLQATASLLVCLGTILPPVKPLGTLAAHVEHAFAAMRQLGRWQVCEIATHDTYIAITFY